MSITAKIVADSVSYKGRRLTTFVLHYPRFIHAELMTHRVFSRNAASSRAIPLAKFIERVKNDPAMPVFWGANKSGMQAAVEVDDPAAAKAWWLETRDIVLQQVGKAIPLNLHKQIINRVMEPWFNIETIVTSTEFGNWYNLRNEKDAQPEIKRLAEEMLDIHNNSVPTLLGPGEWHLPFVTEEERKTLDVETLKQIATARSARVSYVNHEGKVEIAKDLDLTSKLIAAPHASPFEHIATPLEDPDVWDGNFQGWHQYRKDIPNEFRPHYPGLKEPWREWMFPKESK